MSNQWALVIFTVLAQASIGAFIALALLKRIITQSYGAEKSEAMLIKPYAILFPLVVIAILASFFHLHNPLHAPFSILNFGSSWLSREILGICFFALFWLLYILSGWKKFGGAGWLKALIWLGCLAGLWTVFSMSNIYMLEIQPAWNTPMTPVIFFGSVFAIGGVLAGVTLFAVLKDEALPALRFGTGVSLAGVIVALIGVVCRYLILSGSRIAGATASAALITSDYLGPFVVGIIALLAGLGLTLLVYNKLKKQGFSLKYANLALAAIVLGLILDRLVFYSAHIGAGF
jgi:anaerobic dimethyl sulfoxide reductase subunit C (anchor subunit)